MLAGKRSAKFSPESAIAILDALSLAVTEGVKEAAALAVSDLTLVHLVTRVRP